MRIIEEYTNDRWEYTAIHKNKIIGTAHAPERKPLQWLLDWIDKDEPIWLVQK